MGRKLIDEGWRQRQKYLTTAITPEEEREFCRIIKHLKTTRSRALRQLVKGVIDGKIDLSTIAKPETI